MSTVRDLNQLGKLIAAQHGWAAAKAFKSYEMDDADSAVLSKRALDLLKVFPAAASSSAMMSAALAVSLEGRLNAPIQVVAGTLTVAGEPVFSTREAFDRAKACGEPTPAWGGHVWVMIGPYVIDASIFRIAYSNVGPARLTHHIVSTFGQNKGLYVDRWKHTGRVGLGYEPQYVLSPDEVTDLMASAYQLIAQAQATQSS